MPSVRYSFTLDAVKDINVIRWLDSQPNTSAAVREGLKAYIEKPTNADLAAKLDEILNAFQTVQWVATTPAQIEGGDEPAAAVAGFEKMLQKFG
jgi:pyrroline-5-carboxylate reductase